MSCRRSSLPGEWSASRGSPAEPTVSDFFFTLLAERCLLPLLPFFRRDPLRSWTPTSPIGPRPATIAKIRCASPTLHTGPSKQRSLLLSEGRRQDVHGSKPGQRERAILSYLKPRRLQRGEFSAVSTATLRQANSLRSTQLAWLQPILIFVHEFPLDLFSESFVHCMRIYVTETAVNLKHITDNVHCHRGRSSL